MRKHTGWRWPLLAVAISGPSMVPTLRHGDAVLVWRGARRVPRVRPGHVVLARFPALPDRLVVKRAARQEEAGWWLLGDSAAITDDSRRYGAADVLGRVVCRYWPMPPRRVRR